MSGVGDDGRLGAAQQDVRHPSAARGADRAAPGALRTAHDPTRSRLRSPCAACLRRRRACSSWHAAAATTARRRRRRRRRSTTIDVAPADDHDGDDADDHATTTTAWPARDPLTGLPVTDPPVPRDRRSWSRSTTTPTPGPRPASTRPTSCTRRTSRADHPLLRRVPVARTRPASARSARPAPRTSTSLRLARTAAVRVVRRQPRRVSGRSPTRPRRRARAYGQRPRRYYRDQERRSGAAQPATPDATRDSTRRPTRPRRRRRQLFHVPRRRRSRSAIGAAGVDVNMRSGATVRLARGTPTQQDWLRSADGAPHLDATARSSVDRAQRRRPVRRTTGRAPPTRESPEASTVGKGDVVGLHRRQGRSRHVEPPDDLQAAVFTDARRHTRSSSRPARTWVELAGRRRADTGVNVAA